MQAAALVLVKSSVGLPKWTQTGINEVLLHVGLATPKTILKSSQSPGGRPPCLR